MNLNGAKQIAVNDENEVKKKRTKLLVHKMSISTAVFSVISVTIGAGMVAVPKSAYESGIPFALFYHVWNYL